MTVLDETPAPPQDEFPSLAKIQTKVEEPKPKTQKQKQEKAQPVETKPKKEPKKGKLKINLIITFIEIPVVANEDFPTLGGGSKEDFPSLGQVSKPQQGTNAPKKTNKPQYVPLSQPKKTSPAVAAKTKEDLSKNPKYLVDFPSL